MTLVLPPRLTPSAMSIRDAAIERGLACRQLPGFDVPDGLVGGHLHAGPTFADPVAAALGIVLLEAPYNWLAGLPPALLRRQVTVMPIGEAQRLRRPAFVKSPNDKSIKAMIYSDGSRLPGADAVDPETPVLVSDIVDFTAEYRLHVLDGQVHGASRYVADGRLALAEADPSATAFGREMLAEIGDTLPSAIVVDIGSTDDGWAVIEANAAWASGRYLTPADAALDLILRSTGPYRDMSAHDRGFVRSPGRVNRTRHRP